MIDRNKIEMVFFGLLFGTIFTLAFFVFKPFFTALFLAATFAIVLTPLYKEITKALKGRETISALLTILIASIFVVIPIIFLGQEAFEQAHSLYIKLATSDMGEFDKFVQVIEAPIQQIIPSFTLDLDQYVRFSLAWATDNFRDVLFGTLAALADIFFIILSLFFFLKDGKRLVEKAIRLSPLRDTYDKELLEKISTTITTVVKGTLLIALVQGFLAGVGLLIFGVPNAVLWGALAALCAVVPGLGTALVIVPSVIYLFLMGNIPLAIGLAAWGMILVGMIDNVLGPYLYKKGTRLHPLVVLFAVIGGVSFFGPKGLLLGPVIASLLISLVHIYERMVIGKAE